MSELITLQSTAGYPYIIGGLLSLFSFLAGFVALRQLRSSRSSFYIWLALGFFTQTYEQLLHIGLLTWFEEFFEAGRFVTLQPGLFDIGNLLFAILLLIGVLSKPRFIATNNILSMLSAYGGILLLIPVAYLTQVLVNPSILPYMPHSPSLYLPLAEFITVSSLILGVVLLFFLPHHKPNKLTYIIVSSIVCNVASEVFMFLANEPSDGYVLISQVLRVLSLALFALFGSLFFDSARESLENPIRFTLSRQLLLTLTTFTGFLLVLAAYNLQTSQITNPTELATINRYRSLLLGVTSITSICLLYSNTRRITSQFKNLNQSISDIKSGTLNINMDVYSDYEFGNLAAAFEEVITQLNGSSEILRMRVEERTQDLRKQVKEVESQNISLNQIKTDLEHAKSKVELEKAKDEAMLASIGEGVIVVDNSGRIEKINNRALDLLGYGLDDLLKQRAAEKILMYDNLGAKLSETKQPITLALSVGEKTITDKYLFQRKNNTQFPAFIAATPIILNGTVTGGIQVFRDITKEKEIDQAKSEFVSLASHQLRTPLTAISWYTEALISKRFGELTEKQSQYLDEVFRASQRMTELVNALLNVSRIELGAFNIKPQTIELIDFIKSLTGELLPALQKKNQNLVQHLPQAPMSMQLDPSLFHMVVHNLLTNAIKYSPEHTEITLTIEKSSREVTISVTDHGYGIPANEQSKIFSKMYRASNVNAQESEGTGLGLYIVKSIMEKSGGQIWFKSVENQGTTFYLSLPLYGMKQVAGTKTLV